ncbi:hypothetical protein WICPIJ_006852 [Wickerhamomyces pijperi]|uniref:Uncharacterized protein n=1 Tax=Wickerhamomyces pijperi TaxID=599730 RepID=A0A9P8TKK8_WICPI|nr:hypothetical protein WICPIJ_006852 [Wickerhamomyces pijperi]
MKHFAQIEFDLFTDHLLSQYELLATSTNLNKKALIILLDISTPLSIPSNDKRSGVSYLHNVSNFEIIHIDTFQKLLVFLNYIQLSNNIENYLIIAVWGLNNCFRANHWNHGKLNQVFNILTKLELTGEGTRIITADLKNGDLEYDQLINKWLIIHEQ